MVYFESGNAFLKQLEEQTGIQVYDMRTPSKGVNIPYIVCGRNQINSFYADNKIWYSQCIVDVLLFSYSPSDGKENPQPVWMEDTFIAEDKVSSYFRDRRINYTTDYSWMMEEQLLQTHYSIAITYGEENEEEVKEDNG